MTLSEEVKKSIHDEYNEWVDKQYGGKTLKERQELGQFFTPPELTIQMIEQFTDLEGSILDPCCGSGCLLVGCVLSGGDPNQIYGIDLDSKMVDICRERLSKFGVPKEHIHHGNSLNDDCYDHFDSSYYYDENTDSVLLNGRRKFVFGM